MPACILLVHTDQDARSELAHQLGADGHDVYETHRRQHAIALLAGHPVEVLVLGELDKPNAALALLRELRRGELPTAIDPRVAVVTLGGADELDALRAYEAGADHHLSTRAGYLLARAVILAARRSRAAIGQTRRGYRIAGLEIDIAAHRVRVNDELVQLSAKEFALLATLASDPARVFTKQELLRDVWGFKSEGRTRTLDTHACRVRNKLAEHGQRMIENVWGIGYRLVDGPLHQEEGRSLGDSAA